MKNKYRTIYCGEVTKENIGEEIKVAGWVEQIRNLGSLVFLTLRDETGLIQLISEEIDKFSTLTRESTITATGIVRHRADGMTNPNMKTGEVEVLISSYELLGAANNVLPFEINHSKEAFEDTRLKYRYLDLRNPEVHDKILFRTKVLDYMRKIMKDMNFTEIQTPIITASSPEGARDFIIPSRKYKGKFYALPQAPQIFKQLLMCSGFSKYFQIAPCFRDEDPRSDRLYGEFYQLDLEMSFVDEEDVYEVGQKIFYNIFTHFSDKEVSPIPFKRIPYKEAMLKYGSDKPDLRNPLLIEDLTTILSKSTFEPFKTLNIRGIKVDNIDKSNSWYKKIEEYIKSLGATGMSYIKVNEDMTFKSSIDKFLTDDLRKELIEMLIAEVKPAVGCTEPVAVALACAKAKELLGEEIEENRILVSPSIYKNGMCVGIPGTDRLGLKIAVAMGFVGGHSENGLTVLETLSQDEVEESERYKIPKFILTSNCSN